MSDPIIQKLDEMQARCDAATPGPWESDGGEVAQHWSLPEPWEQVVSGHISCMAYCYGGSCYPVEREGDAEFIAASRTDMPKLISALKAVHEKLGIDDYCEACTHGDCETSRTIAKALGVEA